jgi:phosphoglycerate dehydrogenase-like enzyme
MSVPVFEIGLTGDFLNEQGAPACGDLRLDMLELDPRIRYRFLNELAPHPGDAEYWRRFYSLEVTADQIHGLHGLVVLRPWVKASMFARGPQELTVIGRSGAGYDKIDVRACTANDVAVFNAPLALNHATGSSALLFMLALSKRLFQQDRVTRSGHWEQQASVLGREIEGRTLGIIGLGHSGRELVRLAAPFEMRLLAFSPHAEPAQAAALGVRLCSLDEVLREADIVSLHCSLRADTRGLLGARELGLMKPSAFLVNVARGELVDQAALVSALASGRLAGAALDVYEHEPLPPNDPLLSLENVILTPHWNASTWDVWQETARIMAEGMGAAARGRVPANVVNPEVLERPGFQARLARFAAPE